MTDLAALVDREIGEVTTPRRASTTTFHAPRTVQKYVTVGLDAVFIVLAAVVALFGRNVLPWFRTVNDLDSIVGPFWVGIGALWLLVLAALGAYKEKNQGTGTREYSTVFNASALTAGITGVCLYLSHYPLSRGFFVLVFVIGTIALGGERYALRHVLHAARRRGLFTTPVLVSGDSGHIDELVRVLRRESWLGLDVVGCLTDEQLNTTPGGIPCVGSLADIEEATGHFGVDLVLFAGGAFKESSDFRRTAWELEERQVRMIVVPDVSDVSAERVQLRPVAGIPLVHVEPPQSVQAARLAKRLFDIVGAGFLTLLASPVMLLTAIAIKLDDGGPVLFRQKRVGLRGETFSCLKFRSMCVNAEQLQKTMTSDKTDDDINFKKRNDPRITRVGKFIRRTSIDELPQFINVLRGDMSLVGPRPALPKEVAKYSTTALRRLHVRPGLTGLWQVSGRANLSWDDTLHYDLFYVDNWSMMQDMSIIVRTLRAVVRGDGAY